VSSVAARTEGRQDAHRVLPAFRVTAHGMREAVRYVSARKAYRYMAGAAVGGGLRAERRLPCQSHILRFTRGDAISRWAPERPNRLRWRTDRMPASMKSRANQRFGGVLVKLGQTRRREAPFARTLSV
jgi:hypothetical protein